MYTGLIDHTRRMLRAYFDVFLVFKGELRIVRVAHYICHEIMQSWQHCTLFRKIALTLKKMFAFIFLAMVSHSKIENQMQYFLFVYMFLPYVHTYGTYMKDCILIQFQILVIHYAPLVLKRVRLQMKLLQSSENTTGKWKKLVFQC